jgi:hypothetical protein
MLLFWAPPSVRAGDLSCDDPFEIVRVSPQDGAAVVRSSGGALTLIRVGSIVRGFGRVIDITENRVVLQSESRPGRDILVIQSADSGKRVERIRRRAPKRRLHHSPTKKGAL